MKKSIATRQELFDEVWSSPLTKLANKYEISDSGLRKICIKNNIPLPKGGHWSKAKYGKEPKQPKLPLFDEEPAGIELRLRKTRESYISNSNPILARQKEIESSSANCLPDIDFRKAHPIVKKTKRYLNSKDKYDFRENEENGEQTLNITTTKVLEKRALLFQDCLIKILEERGAEITFKYGTPYITIDSQKISFRVREKNKASFTENRHGWRDRTLTPTGKLIFQIDGNYKKKDWADGKTTLEEQISKIAAFIEIKAAKMVVSQIKMEKGWEIQRLRREEEERRKELHENELQKTKELFHQMKLWKKAKELRQFVLKMQNVKSPEWLRWANHKVDWFDPSVLKDDQVLNNKDREVLNDLLLT
jgi:hypothetical protein